MGLLKRVLQCTMMMPANMACGLLYMVSTVLQERRILNVNSELKKMMDAHAFDLLMGEKKEEEEKEEEVMEEERQESEKESEKEGEKESEKENEPEKQEEMEEEGEDEVDDLEEDFFSDIEGETEKESKESEQSDENDENEDEQKDNHEDSNSQELPPLVYNITSRDPGFSHAEQTFLFELSLLCSHYHPTVAHFATLILTGVRVNYPGDPLIDFSNKAFLDKFAYKHAKQKDINNARDRGSAALQSRKKALSRTQIPVNTEEFLNQKEEDVAQEDKFFYKYFKERAKRTGGKKKKTEEEEEEEMDQFAQDLAMEMMNQKVGEEDNDFLAEFEDEENGHFMEDGEHW